MGWDGHTLKTKLRESGIKKNTCLCVCVFCILAHKNIPEMANTLPKMLVPAATNAEIKSVCVFCGSGSGADPIYEQEAKGIFVVFTYTFVYIY